MTHYGVFSLALLVAACFTPYLLLLCCTKQDLHPDREGREGPPMKKNPSLQGQTPCTTPDCDTVLQATFRDKV